MNKIEYIALSKCLHADVHTDCCTYAKPHILYEWHVPRFISSQFNKIIFENKFIADDIYGMFVLLHIFSISRNIHVLYKKYSSYLQLNETTTLSYSTRIKGFCICFIIGILFTLLGSFALILHLGMTRFAIFYTLGNVISMARYWIYY